MTSFSTFLEGCPRPGGGLRAPLDSTPGVEVPTPRSTRPPTLRLVGSMSRRRAPESFDDIVPRALDGDRDAWNVLVDRLQGVVWHAISGFDLRTEDRKDAFAATFFRLHERLSTVREPKKLPGWVATTARNEVHTLLRSRRRLVPSDPADLAAAPDPAANDDPVIEDELVGAVHRGFATLPARCQELLRLATLDPPLSYAEIGEALGMPHGSIGPTRQRCLDQLRRSAALAPFVAGSDR